MKNHIISILLIALLRVTLSACQTPSDPVDDPATDVPSDTAATTVPGRDDSPAAERVALIFYNYEEFVRFAETGDLDENKFEEAAFLKTEFAFVQEMFLDVKDLFDLPDMTKGRSEEIIIQDPYEFMYFVNSDDASGRIKNDFCITVSYEHPSNSSKIVDDPTTAYSVLQDFESLANAADGTYRLQNENCTMLYYKSDGAYYLLDCLLKDGHCIRISFAGEKLTPSQITSICGETIAALFSGNTETVDNATSALRDWNTAE